MGTRVAACKRLAAYGADHDLAAVIEARVEARRQPGDGGRLLSRDFVVLRPCRLVVLVA